MPRAAQSLTLNRYLDRLRQARIHYTLAQNRDDAVMVCGSVPGQRWEVEFLNDGGVETEVFRSDGTILDQDALDTMIQKFTD